jgi:hypothetical protein
LAFDEGLFDLRVKLRKGLDYLNLSSRLASTEEVRCVNSVACVNVYMSVPEKKEEENNRLAIEV